METCNKCKESIEKYWCEACLFHCDDCKCSCGSVAISDTDYHQACI